jgi:hypothetical protein
MNFFKKQSQILIILGTALLSIVAWIISAKLNLIMSYSDAISHLNVARFVVDNRQPGLAQLGTVWLPLNHILYLPLVWNDWLWHTGLAGSLVSMTAFVIAAVYVYKIVLELVASKLAAFVGALVFALNLNILYLQTTPLTESVYIATLVVSIYFLIRYLTTSDSKYLLPLGLFTAAQVMSRYDGWFVVLAEAGILFWYGLFMKKEGMGKAFGNVILFVTPVIFAVLVWLGWNLVIFGNPLYFLTGPYSAHIQQALIISGGQYGRVMTVHNLANSVKDFSYAIIANVGMLIVFLGLIGWSVYLVFNRHLKTPIRVAIMIALATVVIFNVASLYLGFSIINLPSLHWNNTHNPAVSWFNTRYGIVALPFFAVGAGLLVAGRKLVAALVVVAIFAQGMQIYQAGLITVQDGTVGLSAFVYHDSAKSLKDDVKPGQTVLMSASSYSGIAFESGLPLRQFIVEGDSSIWNDALAHPSKYAVWIVMSNRNMGDPVNTRLVVDEKSTFLSNYTLVEAGNQTNLYRLRK